LPKPLIGPVTRPRFIAAQIMAFIQVTTVVSRSSSSGSLLCIEPQPPHGM
jgi:hypothetical protein